MARRRKWGLGRKGPLSTQGELAFAATARRRERAFQRSIAVATAAIVIALLAGTSAGRYVAARLALRGRELVSQLMGLPADRSVRDDLVRGERSRAAAAAREALAHVAAPGSDLDSFLRTVGMDARAAVVRWGNVDRAIVLSSAVFEPDDERSYRLRPGVRAVWVVGLAFDKALAIFLVPDTPLARAAAERAGGHVVPESVQITNSWGCRGPEPDPSAPVRIMVLGDSMMQGALVGEAETPPARLNAHLSQALGATVSVLNTGHLGYSPEQYDATLRAFSDRFHPQFVVISLSTNDFGDLYGQADWAEADYWVNRMADFCNQRGIEFLFVPTPEPAWLLGRREIHLFQGPISRILKRGGRNYVDPLENFTDALLEESNQQLRAGAPLANPFFNLHLMGDRHFSPLGSELWARVVARRLLLGWDRVALSGQSCPEPVVRHARAAHPAVPAEE